MTPSRQIELRGVEKRYPGLPEPVLRGIDLTVAAGETVAVVGPSGSGKSTLLHLLGGLDRPSTGEVLCCGDRLGELDGDGLARFRRDKVGFVFQMHHLLPQCSAYENVLVPSLVAADPARRAQAPARAIELLGRVGLGDRLHHRPAQLSGGERQRVAVVRALINRPLVLLADEPTGALNQTAARALVEVLLDLNAAAGTTLVVVTHAAAVAARMGRALTLRDGRLVDGFVA